MTGDIPCQRTYGVSFSAGFANRQSESWGSGGLNTAPSTHMSPRQYGALLCGGILDSAGVPRWGLGVN